jgi:GNAT superfamily N-acetyltransferase
MNNWNPNEENVKTIVEKGKVYMKVGNQKILVRNMTQVQPKKKHAINVRGPGTYFRNHPNKRRNAMNVVRNTQAKQINYAKHTMSLENYKKFIMGLLDLSYVLKKLESVGKLSHKNWVAVSKNNGSIQGFAVVHNTANGQNRNLNVLATRSGQGTGRMLMNRIIANAKKNGKNLHLTSVKTAVPFYTLFGFKGNSNGNRLTPMSLKLR